VGTGGARGEARRAGPWCSSGAGGDPAASSAGVPALGRRIQRRHLPTAGPPVPADVWPHPTCRAVAGGRAGGPTRPRVRPASTGSGAWVRRPPHVARGIRPPLRWAVPPRRGRARPSAGTSVSELTREWW